MLAVSDTLSLQSLQTLLHLLNPAWLKHAPLIISFLILKPFQMPRQEFVLRAALWPRKLCLFHLSDVATSPQHSEMGLFLPNPLS